MATLTTNLFHGQGERDHRLDVVEGRWPDDVEGSVLVVGPDKRAPGGHWFGEQGLVERIRMRPDGAGRVVVEHRRVATRLDRLRARHPRWFAKVKFMELSPFGVSNLANTNIAGIEGRLFVGYDAGRPVELDADTLECVTPVGANDEWLQSAPGLLEPLCAVAAHPAADVEESAMYFVNYSQLNAPGTERETWLARWDLHGPVRRWRVAGMSPYDSIHDVKTSASHVVISDLPFVVEPDGFRGAPRTRRNQEHTSLWIVPKADLGRAEAGGTVQATEVRLPMPTGHLLVDREEPDGLLRIVLQHMPLADLMISMDAEMRDHRNGMPIERDYEGMVALALQPSVIGRYLIDPVTGRVVEADLVADHEQLWGGILTTSDIHRVGARQHQRQLWYAGCGFDPDLVPQPWWDLYGEATDGLVAPEDLPTVAVPGTLARIDLESMKVAEVWSYPDGAFPSPPTFVPRAGSVEPDDGYVVVVVHRDGDKELQIFDARCLERGPVARATAPGFHPGLLLHSTWMPDRVGPRGSDYQVPVRRDVVGALRGIPRVLMSVARMARDTRRAAVRSS
jgi:carotenoid cleavage dioxygenase-like enzyme